VVAIGHGNLDLGTFAERTRSKKSEAPSSAGFDGLRRPARGRRQPGCSRGRSANADLAEAKAPVIELARRPPLIAEAGPSRNTRQAWLSASSYQATEWPPAATAGPSSRPPAPSAFGRGVGERLLHAAVDLLLDLVGAGRVSVATDRQTRGGWPGVEPTISVLFTFLVSTIVRRSFDCQLFPWRVEPRSFYPPPDVADRDRGWTRPSRFARVPPRPPA
jgi:hypothetical protein